MAVQIPDATNIATREYSTEKAVVSRDTSYAGQNLESLSGAANKLYERQIKSEVAQAGVDYQVMKANQDVMYDDDDDEDTIEERYNAGVSEGLGKAAENITDARVRDAFVQSKLPAIEQGKLKIQDKVHAKRGDKKIAALQGSTELIIKGAISGDDLGDAHQSLESAWENLREEGHVSAVNAEKAVRAAKYEMALGKLNTLEPEDQIIALDSEWAKELPEDKLKELRDKARNKLMDDEALTLAQVWSDNGLTLAQVNARLNKITDADMYDKLRNRFLQLEADEDLAEAEGMDDRALGMVKGWEQANLSVDEVNRKLIGIEDAKLFSKARTFYLQRQNDDERGLQELQNDLYTEHFVDVAEGNKRVSDIPDIERYRMTPAQYTNLQSAEDKATRRAAGEYVPTYSDPAVVEKLRGFIARDEIQKGKTYFSENFAKLNDNDFRYYNSQTTLAKVKPQKGLRTANQTMVTLLKDNDLNNDPSAQAMIWDNVNARYDQYWDEHGKEPDNKTVTDWVKTEFLEIRRDPGAIFFDDDEYVYDLDPEQRAQFYQTADMLRSRNPNATREYIVEKFEAKLEWENAIEGMSDEELIEYTRENGTLKQKRRLGITDE